MTPAEEPRPEPAPPEPTAPPSTMREPTPPEISPLAPRSPEDAPETVLDLRGLNCPLPVLKTRRALAKMPKGTHLRALATDPMSAIDIPHMCNEDGHRLVSAGAVEGRLEFVIERG